MNAALATVQGDDSPFRSTPPPPSKGTNWLCTRQLTRLFVIIWAVASEARPVAV
jgi:hypothetical protein